MFDFVIWCIGIYIIWHIVMFVLGMLILLFGGGK